MLFFLGVKDVENSEPVFDPDFHTELIIKDKYEDFNSANMKTYIIIEKLKQSFSFESNMSNAF